MEGIEGYAKLAWLMGAHPEVAIFRRFGALNAQNLLYLQAELVFLEHKLRDLAHKDSVSGHPQRREYSGCWYLLNDSITTTASVGEDGEQWKTFLQIRQKLWQYNKAILQQKKITRLEDPNPKDLETLVNLMKRKDHVGPCITGLDANTWAETDPDDLLAIRVRGNEDLFTAWIEEKGLAWFYKKFGDMSQKPVNPILGKTVSVPQKKILRISRILSTILSSSIPVLSIIALHFIESTGKRLAAIACFTVAFSLALEVFTTARAIDVFTAAAAFAAVQVVYVGTTSVPGHAGSCTS